MSNAPYSPSPQYPPAPQYSPPAEAVFAPLPLRPRGVLENLDLAFKLFKQYWRPLLAWAALTNLLMTVATYFSFFVGPPFIIGATCCVLAAAVRGQAVGFKQCWGFTKPRLGNLMAVHVLSSLLSALVIGVLVIAITLLGAWIGTALPLGDIWGIVLAVLAGALVSIVVSMALAWQGMVGMVACMEDDCRDVKAMKRAWALLRGRWKAALGLLTTLNLALLVLWGALWGVFGVLIGVNGIGRAALGRGNDMAGLGAIGALLVSSWALFTLFMPIYYLAQALFYLDARVRHEALDLEWNSHRTSEAAPPQPQFNPQAATPQTFFERVETPQPGSGPPAGSSTWAPPPFGSSNSAPASPTLEQPSPFAAPSASASTSPFAAPTSFAAPGPLSSFAAPASISLHKPEPGEAGALAPAEEAGDQAGGSPFAAR